MSEGTTFVELRLTKKQIARLAKGDTVQVLRGGTQFILGIKKEQTVVAGLLKQREALDKKIAAIAGIECDECHKTLPSKRSLAQHIRFAHKGAKSNLPHLRK